MLVTHAIDFLHLADRIVLMKDGAIEVQGAYNEIKDDPNIKKIVDMHDKNKEEQAKALKDAEDLKASKQFDDLDMVKVKSVQEKEREEEHPHSDTESDDDDETESLSMKKT